MNVARLLTNAPDPHRAALIFPERSITFAELEALASEFAADLRRKGLEAGDRALLLAPLSVNVYAILIGLFKIGAAAVFLDPQSDLRQLAHAAHAAQAQALIGNWKVRWFRPFIHALRSIPILIDAAPTDGRSKALAPPASEIADVDSDDLALITFTGGTTAADGGRGVQRTHGLLLAQHEAIAQAFPVEPGDVDMPGFPIVSLHNLASGITSVIPEFGFRHPERISPENTIRLLKEHGVTTASGSPAYWRPIARYCTQAGENLGLRRILVGGATAGPKLMRELVRAAPGAEIVSVYGSTEAEPIATISASEVLAETAALTANGAGIPLGRPVEGVEVRILAPVASDVGEICVSGAHVSRGYINAGRPSAEDRHFEADGKWWYRTGDFGYEDAKGRLWIAGRAGTAVRQKSGAMYPIPLEAMIDELPFVRRSALVGLGNADAAQQLRLNVELEPGTPLPGGWETEVRSMCARGSWRLEEIRVVRRIPMDRRHNARIDYRRLRARGAAA